MKILSLLLATTLAVSAPAFSAGFTNLDFESAVVQINDPNFGVLDWALAVPGWNHGGGSGSEFVYYRHPHLGMTPWYLLIDDHEFNYGSFLPLAGNYSLSFWSGVASSNPEEGHPWAFISQTGDILPGTRSLRLLATGSFSVFLDDVFIPMFHLGGNSYGGDVSAFAGTTANLTIRAEGSPDPSVMPPPVLVDEIVFLPVAVPEPGTLALALLAAGCLAQHRRR
jgi:hypothetical protein